MVRQFIALKHYTPDALKSANVLGKNASLCGTSEKIIRGTEEEHKRHSSSTAALNLLIISEWVSKSVDNSEVEMKNAPGGDEILEVIRLLSARGASGRLQVSTGMTDGALFFNKGQLVDVQVGKVRGFQAINALAVVPDASYHFDPAVLPPAQSSITAKERLLLKDFFGIEAAEPELDDLGTTDYSDQQQRAMPEDIDEVTLIAERVAPPIEPPIAQPPMAVVEPIEPPIAPPTHTPTFAAARPATPAFRPALFMILTVLMVAAALALLYRFRKTDTTASTVPTVQTSAPAMDQAPAPADVPQQPATDATAAAIPDLTGNWNVVNTVEQTSYHAYKNMQVGFNVSINQSGKDFTGKGEKISENGRSLPATSRTPIEVKGTIDGDRVEATFSESGAMRKTNGRFVWRIDKTNRGLNGTFVTNAARSRGKSAARKT